MESCELFKSENPKLSPKEYIEKYELENVLSEMLNTLVSKKNKKPEIFMIKYLCSLLSKEEKLKYGIHDNTTDQIDKIPLVLYPQTLKNEMIKNNLTKNFWESKKYTKSSYKTCIQDIFDLEKDSNGLLGISSPDSKSFELYKDFLQPFLIEHFNIFLHKTDYNNLKIKKSVENVFANYTKDFFFKAGSNFLNFFKFEFRRNLKRFSNELKTLNKEDQELLINIVSETLTKINTNNNLTKKTIRKNEKEFSKVLSDRKLNLENENNEAIALICLENIIIILNDDSNLRISISYSDLSENINVLEKFESLYHELREFTILLDENLKFEFSENYGYLNKNPNHLGISLSFYAEINSPELVNNLEFFEVFKNNFTTKSSNTYANLGNLNKMNDNSFNFEIFSFIHQTEIEFLEEINNKLYNINYLISTYLDENSLHPLKPLDFEELKKDTNLNVDLLNNTNFNLENIYKKIFPIYKYTFYPNNINFNNFILDLLKNKNDNKNFDLFKFFFEEFFNKFKYYNSLNSSRMNPLKVPDSDNNSVKAYRDYSPFSYPFSNEEFKNKIYLFLDENFNKVYSKLFVTNDKNLNLADTIKNFSIKIFRNFENFNFVHLLTEDEKNLIKNIIDDVFILDSEVQKINNSYKINDFVNLHVNQNDHLIYEVNTKLDNKNKLSVIEEFIKKFNTISSNLELVKKHKFAFLNNIGFLSSDFSRLGLGYEFSIELDTTCFDHENLNAEIESFKLKNIKNIIFTNDEAENTLIISNYQNDGLTINYFRLQNLLENAASFLMNLKVVEKKTDVDLNKLDSAENLEKKEIEKKDEGNKTELEKLLNSGIDSEFNNELNSLNGSSLHLNDSKVSERGEDKQKDDLENSCEDKKISHEDDVLICDESAQ